MHKSPPDHILAENSGAVLEPQVRYLQCMEVWGGNHAVDSGVVMAGVDAWVWSRPCGDSEVGGDVHYVSSCGAGMIMRTLLADVSGHGQKVSDTARQLRKLMRKYINFHDQRRLVRAVNEQFGALAGNDRFATAVVLTYEAELQRMRLSSAGHPPPLHYRVRTGDWSYLGSSQAEPAGANLPLGIGEGDYQQIDTTVAVGDLVLCYTDGLLEAKNADGVMIDAEVLLDIVHHVKVDPPSEFLGQLAIKVLDQHPENLQHDDVTMLLMRPNGIGLSYPFLAKLAAPFKILAAAVGLYRPGEE
jgi:serine phosphatase RsbU (regulator of sigma subunit)